MSAQEASNHTKGSAAAPTPQPELWGTTAPAATLQSFSQAVWLVWTAFAAVDALAGGRPRSLSLNVFAALITLAVQRWTRRRPEHWRVGFHVLLTATTLSLVCSSWLSGGAQGFAWWYLSAVPLFVAHIADRRTMFVWTGFAIAGVLLSVSNPFGVRTEVQATTMDRTLGAVLLTVVTAVFGTLARVQLDDRLRAIVAGAKAKGELLATISHELRTPLHGILGIASVLHETPLSPEQQSLVTTIRDSGKTLNRIVDDVLDVARLEAGRLPIVPSPVDLLTVLEDLVDFHASEAAAKGLVLTVELAGHEGLHVVGDGLRIRQILSNLLNNAVKFTTKGHVLLRADSRVEGPWSQLVLRVEDTGPGLGPEQLEHLFQPFAQADAKLARLHGGSGLGLALARDLVQRMGGTLGLEARDCDGACFTIRLKLPLAKALGSREASPTVPSTPVPELILIETREAYRRAAESLAAACPELRVLSAPSLAEARARYGATKPAAILLCPTGFEPAELEAHVQALEQQWPKVPVVLGLAVRDVALEAKLAPGFAATTSLPLRRARFRALCEPEAFAPPAPQQDGARRRVLVVDDDATNRRILLRLLASRGWLPIQASSGAEALALLPGGDFTAVLCDLHMPGLSGLQVVERARQSGSKAYFVAVTASVREADREACSRAGFDGFLRKPFEPTELEAILLRTQTLPQSTAKSPRTTDQGLTVTTTTSPDAIAPELLDAPSWQAFRELLAEDTPEAVREFSANAREYLVMLRAEGSSHIERVRAAHTLGSSALQVGLKPLGMAARELEIALQQGPKSNVPTQIQVVENLVEPSLHALATNLRDAPKNT